MTLLPGTLFLIDTSAWMRADHDDVRAIIEDQLDAGIACTCITIELEVGFSARSAAELNRNRKTRNKLLIDLIMDERSAKRAKNVQQIMADKGLHRVSGAMDLLTAAVAELNGAIVLHYDADFEHIASVTGQRQQWIVPRGSVD